MLRDRGFEIRDDEIEETYEEFEKKYLAKSSMLSFVTKRAVAGNQIEVYDGQSADATNLCEVCQERRETKSGAGP